MPINMTTSMDSITRSLEQAEEARREAIVREMLYIGEQCLNTARSLPSPPQSLYWDAEHGEPLEKIPRHTPHYIDWTANLRSSIGYIVVVDGEIVHTSPFSQESTTATEGPEKGRSLAEDIAAKYPSGIALIFVAGMNYAAYVQLRGYDVTESAQILAERLVKQAFNSRDQ